jgi:hypothetical protein
LFLRAVYIAAKKTDVVRCLEASNHVGLLVNELLGQADSLFIQSSNPAGHCRTTGIGSAIPQVSAFYASDL